MMMTPPSTLSKARFDDAQILALARTYGQETDNLGKFLGNKSAEFPSDVCYGAAKALLNTLVKGLENREIPISAVQEIKDNIQGCLLNGAVSRGFWNNLSKREQEDFHSLNLKAINTIQVHDDGTLGTTAVELMRTVTNRTLTDLPLRYVDLKSEEIVDLFVKAKRPEYEINAVRSFLEIKDNSPEASITPRELGLAAVTLAYRAMRQTLPDRIDGRISCYQACQLVELSLNAFSLLGTENKDFPKSDFGSRETRKTILDWAVTQNIYRPIDAVVALAKTEPEKQDGEALIKFSRDVFRK